MAVLCGIVVLVLLLNVKEMLPTATVPSKPAFAGTPLPVPVTGTVWLYFTGAFVPSLTVETRGGADHYLVKVEDWSSGRAVAMLFVRAGETGRLNVPPGTYRIKFAVGNTWYGENLRFGPDEACYIADKHFDFYHYERDGQEHWADQTIKLYPVANGNLSKSRISREQF